MVVVETGLNLRACGSRATMLSCSYTAQSEAFELVAYSTCVLGGATLMQDAQTSRDGMYFVGDTASPKHGASPIYTSGLFVMSGLFSTKRIPSASLRQKLHETIKGEKHDWFESLSSMREIVGPA